VIQSHDSRNASWQAMLIMTFLWVYVAAFMILHFGMLVELNSESAYVFLRKDYAAFREHDNL
jgi:hypothetical protein